MGDAPDDMMIGDPFPSIEAGAFEWLLDLGTPLVVCANEPPWASVRPRLADRLVAEVAAWDMDSVHLARMADGVAAALSPSQRESSTVVGLGGGTALDTAKFLSWHLGLPLVQVPTITSVDASFTDAVGIRDAGRVKYVGRIRPLMVLVDLPLIRSAPPRLNRAGVGDILSCHTGLFDWRLAAAAGHGHPWDDSLAALGNGLLDELESAAADIAAVSEAGVRFIAGAYRRIGAACASAGHSRFEEGSEHFWAYAYEHATGAHPVHGEIISLATCALAHVQGNDPDRVRRIVSSSGVRANPLDLGVTSDEFAAALLGLAEYSRANDLDVGIADVRPITTDDVHGAWDFIAALPRRGD